MVKSGLPSQRLTRYPTVPHTKTPEMSSEVAAQASLDSLLATLRSASSEGSGEPFGGLPSALEDIARRA